MNRRGFMAAAAGFLMAPFERKPPEVHWLGAIEMDPNPASLDPLLGHDESVLVVMDDNGEWHQIPPLRNTFPISFKEEA
jgi:hypothetical protein